MIQCLYLWFVPISTQLLLHILISIQNVSFLADFERFSNDRIQITIKNNQNILIPTTWHIRISTSQVTIWFPAGASIMAAINTLMRVGPNTVYVYSSLGLGWSLVDCSPWSSCCKWPLAVTMLGGECLVTNVSSRTGNVARKTCLVPLRSSFDIGFPNELCWYCTRSILVIFSLEITLAWCMLGLADGNKSTWMSHKRFCKSLVPVKMNCTYLLNISTSVSVKVYVHPSSHIYPIENR